ncbi:MAG TPA: mechanosensitive ion channel, partial [Promineifilum sp.]|nr:mechanosensitive ion channel [Promineifilum sp.]
MTFEQDILQTVVEFVIRIGLAVLVFLLGRYLADKSRDVAAGVMRHPEIDQALGPAAERFIRQVAYFGILLLSFLVALVVLGVPVAAVVSISGAVIIMLGIALRESLANLVATLTIIFYATYRLGEDIDVGGKVGTVREIQLFSTLLLMGDKGLLTLPNGEILDKGVINLSRLGIRRADVEFLVEYGQDMAHVERIVLDALRREPRVLETPPPYVSVTQLGVNGVTMQARSVAQLLLNLGVAK